MIDYSNSPFFRLGFTGGLLFFGLLPAAHIGFTFLLLLLLLLFLAQVHTRMIKKSLSHLCPKIVQLAIDSVAI